MTNRQHTIDHTLSTVSQQRCLTAAAGSCLARADAHIDRPALSRDLHSGWIGDESPPALQRLLEREIRGISTLPNAARHANSEVQHPAEES